jgi:hypothetical protein
LLYQTLRDEEEAALQHAWIETQMSWLNLKPFLQKARPSTTSMETRLATLDQRFLALCTGLSDETCVRNSAPVKDIICAWSAANNLLSSADGQQDSAIQFGKSLQTFLQKVELHIAIGERLD